MSKNVGDLGKLIVAKGFKKVAQSPINCPIWTHCSQVPCLRKHPVIKARAWMKTVEIQTVGHAPDDE